MSYVRRTVFFQLLLFQATWKVSLGNLLILMDQTRGRVFYLIFKHREIKNEKQKSERNNNLLSVRFIFSQKMTDSGINMNLKYCEKVMELQMRSINLVRGSDFRDRNVKLCVNSALSCSKH